MPTDAAPAQPGTPAPLLATLDLFRALRDASGIKVSRHFEGFFADRLLQAASAPHLLAAAEHLARSLDASTEYVGGARTAAFMRAAHAPDAPSVLAWLRANPRIAALVCALRDPADYAATVASIALDPDAVTDDSVIDGQRVFDVGLSVTCLAPLAHGADQKAGNATLFRRRQVITPTGRILSLPFYGGNALRGQVRDLLADYTLSQLGLTPDRGRPPVALWFFHLLYAGGALQERGVAAAEGNRAAGEVGAGDSLKCDGVRQFRAMLPGVSLLGCALGNKILPGRLHVGDLRPRCREWGTGDTPAAELLGWEYLTRRDDHEGRGADDDSRAMIATTECLREGAQLSGGIDIDTHANELERAALGRALLLLARRGLLGADNRRGLGKVQIEVTDAPDPAAFDDDLQARKADVLDYLVQIGALNPDLTAPAAPPRAEKPAKAGKGKAKGKAAGPDTDADAGIDPDDPLPEGLL